MSSSTPLTQDRLADVVRSGFGEGIRVSTRRPGRIFQVSIPAYMSDGDAVIIFIEKTKRAGVLRVTDLAHTLMRLTYEDDFTDDMLAGLEALAERNGFSVSDGAVQTEVPERELLPALMGLVQIEACAEGVVAPRAYRGPRPEEFRRLVIEALKQEFRDRVQEHYVPPGAPNSDFEIDAVVNFGRTVAVAAIPSDIEAERAVGTRFALSEKMPRALWLAVPKDIERLTKKSKSRLMKAYTIPSAEFDPRALASRINELAVA